MPNQLEVAGAELRVALKNKGLCVWEVNPNSNAYKLGLLWGVTLSWPGEATGTEVRTVKNATERVSFENDLRPNLNSPTFAAGGVYVMYCGFETPALVAVKRRAEESGKPIWQVCQEEPALLG